jgi:phytanoyl-CoA hydroxylase
MQALIDDFNKQGFLVFDDLILDHEIEELRRIYDDFLNGKYDLDGYRSDLTGDTSADKKVEKITQIMRPSLILPHLASHAVYHRVLSISKILLGPDMAVDFDMMISKAPMTDAETPWHQDAAYWPKVADLRASSFWIALDDVDAENGCMRYVFGSNNEPLRNHQQPASGGALQCIVTEEDDLHLGNVKAGSAIAHHGFTIHGALGNKSTDRHRRAWIINLRPQSMIDAMRSQGYDHLGKREQRS